MRALTLHQPWATAIVVPELAKDIENRTTLLPPAELLAEPRPYFAIHAGLHYDHGPATAKNLRASGQSIPYGMTQFPLDVRVPEKDEVPFGAVIGVARVRYVLDMRGAPRLLGGAPFTQRPRTVDAMREHFEAELADAKRMMRMPWWLGPIGWRLYDVVRIEPVPCKGMLGVWTLPSDVEAQVRYEVGCGGGGRD